MRPVTVTVGPLAAASATAIASAQAPTSAFTLTSSPAVLDTARRVLFTTASASDNGKTVTLVGIDGNNQSQTEIVTLVNAAGVTTAVSALDYKSVTSATISSAAVGNISIGTNTTASSVWVRLDEWSIPQTSVQVTVSGTVNYTLQQTLQDPNSPTNPIAPYLVSWVNSSDPNMVNQTLTAQSSYAYAPIFVKLTLNSGTGSVTGIFAQSGVVSY
jgi:hypothetical protein